MVANFQHFTFGVVLLLLIGITAFPQEQSVGNNHFDDSDSRLINCEQYSADIDGMRSVNSELLERSDYIVLIARLGNGERSRELNRRRLNNVRVRLMDAGIESRKIVVAEGERVAGLGRVEIYAGGKKIEGLRVRRNEDICVECCGPDERYYPFREAYERQRRQSRRRRG